MKIIIFEGTDGVGKTTLKKALEKKSNWKYKVIDRFTGSGIVYDKLYGREDLTAEAIELEANLNEIADVYLVYLNCDTQLQLERLKEKKEDKDIIQKINKAKALFIMYLVKTPLKVIKIDTGNPIDECVDEIIKTVEKEV